MNWFRRNLEKEPREYNHTTSQLTASYRGCAAKNAVYFMVQTHLEYLSIERAEEKLKEWFQEGKVDLRIDVDLIVEEVVTAPPTAQPTASTSRQSATAVAMANLAGQVFSEARTGNLLPELGLRWPCKNSRCTNYNSTCYVRGADLPSNHYPIDASCLRIWAQDIRDGGSTIENPSADVLVKLVDAKHRQPRSVPAPMSTPTAPQASQIIVLPQITQMSPTPSPISYQLPVVDTPSSPIRTDIGFDILRTEFISWLRRRVGWSNEGQLIDRLAQVLDNDNYDIDGIRTITEDVWIRVWGFNRGELPRLQREVRPFKQWWANRR